MPKGTAKKKKKKKTTQQNKTQSQKKKRNHKDESRIKWRLKKKKKINETKSQFFEKINKLINLQPDSSRKKRAQIIKSEMKKKLQSILQKLKEL